MRLAFQVFIVLALCGATDSAQGSERPYCTKARSQMELNRCWVREADNANQRLAAALKSTLEKTAVRVQTEQAQAKWLDYRDAQCAAVAAIYEGGSMQPMQRAACLVRLTDQRIAELKAVLPESK
jgi:uncharacterized protein YecT (DUF1311 family)